MDTTYIAFLRAVNVGKRKVPMAELRELLTGLGLDGVRTYIQTGNAFFQAPARASRAKLTRRLEEAIEERFGFAVPTVVRTVDEVQAALDADPFADVTVTDDTRLALVFLTGPVPKGTTFPVVSPKGDFTILGLSDAGDAYLVDESRASGRPGNPGKFFEDALGAQGTARFWHTTAKIVAAARAD
jgi:uncharacterized protein (DUF1697 family)